MILNDIFFLIIIIIIISFSFTINITNSLFYLILAEIIWITLYAIILISGFYFDNINILSLSFFFLLISAVEFSIGIVIIFIQILFLRSLEVNKKNNNKFFYFLTKNKIKL